MIMTDREPVIRVATRDDIPGIEALLVASDLPTAGIHDDVCGFLVAEQDARIVGVVGMERHGRYGLLRSTAVAPEYRGHGVARRLVDRIIADAEGQGVNALYLLTTTAERYFPSFGFSVTERDVVPDDIKQAGEFKEACPASATVMCLPLAAST
jgi:N-acetylglutamate synthase-like GNAT family acetyltransferase